MLTTMFCPKSEYAFENIPQIAGWLMGLILGHWNPYRPRSRHPRPQLNVILHFVLSATPRAGGHHCSLPQ
jgi:hypothetical protein